MQNVTYTKIYMCPEYDRKEILRYAGMRDGTTEVLTLMEDCIEESRKSFSYKVCFREFPISFTPSHIDLGFAKNQSQNLMRNLQGCDSVILFAATVGIEIDRLIARQSRISPAKALMLQAIGAERIESLCDMFNREINEEKIKFGKTTVPRFSPGYGDLPLELQKDIFTVLNCPKNIGLSLNSSLLMSPSKSVTAIIGIR